jgi:hypothetical protein
MSCDTLTHRIACTSNKELALRSFDTDGITQRACSITSRRSEPQIVAGDKLTM